MDNDECITQDMTCGSVCHMITKTISSTIKMQKRTQFTVQIKCPICIWLYQSTVPKRRQNCLHKRTDITFFVYLSLYKYCIVLSNFSQCFTPSMTRKKRKQEITIVIQEPLNTVLVNKHYGLYASHLIKEEIAIFVASVRKGSGVSLNLDQFVTVPRQNFRIAIDKPGLNCLDLYRAHTDSTNQNTRHKVLWFL